MKIKLFLLILCFFYIINAEGISAKFENITTDQGLSQNTVNCVIQDKRGFLWFGTQDGLNKYDGYNLTIYNNDPDNPKSIGGNYIWSLFEDSRGNLWIGTDGGGLNKYNRETDDFSIFRHIPGDPESISNNSINTIYEDRSGNLWIGTFYGLNKFSIKNQKFINYINKSDKLNYINHNNIRSILEDREGTLWTGTQNGLFKFNKNQGRFAGFNYLSESLYKTRSTNIRSIFEDKSGSLWIGIDGVGRGNGGLYTLSKTSKRITPHKSLQKKITNIWTIYKGRDKSIWIGSRIQGLFKIKDNNLIHFKTVRNNPNGINSSNVRSIYEDRAGIIWIGTVQGGVNIIDRQKNKFNYRTIFPYGSEKRNFNIISLAYGSKSGNLWVGTKSSGIFRFDAKSEDKPGEFNVKQISGPDLSNNIITTTLEDTRGWVWVGTKHKGLIRFNPRKNMFNRYENKPDDPDSLSYNVINIIYEDRSGTIWIGTQHHGGLNRFNPETESFIRYQYNPNNPNSLSDNSIKSIFEDKKGILWIGTRNGGLNRFDRKTKTFYSYKNISNDPTSLSNNFINDIFEDSSGTLWIGSHSGLNKFLRKENKFLRFGEKQGLTNDVISKIIEDKNNCLWISTNKGLSKFNPKTEIFKNYDINDGLIINSFDKNVIFKTKNGKIFLGAFNGINSFFPENIKKNPYIPPIVFTSFKKLYKKVKLSKCITEIKELELDHTDSIISFEFAALNYSNPTKNNYSYFLKGFNKDWVDLGTKHEVTFTNLDPGNYTLKIRGSNNDGVWNKKGLELKIIIPPPFWETWWFKLFLTILFVTLSYIIINFIRKHISLISFWKKKNYIGDYKIINKIASGGMGIVYESRNPKNKSQKVAIKVIRDEFIENDEKRKRFMNESSIIDKIDNKNIVKVIERCESGDQLFIVMEYLEGETLNEKIEKKGKLRIETVIRIAIQLVSAVISIHKQGIIHRDITPDNIMLINKGNQTDNVKILDFGIAKTRNMTKLTESGIIMGTINYISPEQISGISTKASDIYSLGIIFYEMSTGEKPFMAETSIDIINQILNNKPVEPGSFNYKIPKELSRLIMSMMEKNPEQRPSVEKILKTLNRIKADNS